MKAVRSTSSYLLVGFLVANFWCLALVNWPDANVRSYVWKMLSGTVSIYLGVLANSAGSSMLMKYIVFMGQEEPGHGQCPETPRLALEIVLRSLIFVSFLLGLTYFCRKFKKGGKATAQALDAVEIIGAHLTAFAGKELFEAIMCPYHDLVPALSSFLILIAVALLSVAMRLGLASLRYQFFGSDEFSNLDMHSGHVHSWEHVVMEAEDEAWGILLSFVIAATIFQNTVEFEEEHIMEAGSMDSIIKVFGVAIVVMLFLLLATWLRQKGGEWEKNTFLKRLVKCIQQTAGMTLSWMGVWIFEWVPTVYFQWRYPDRHPDLHLVDILSAAILTVAAVICILILDKLADKVVEHPNDGAASETPRGAEDALLRHSSVANANVFAGVKLGKQDIANLESSFRTLIEAICLAVGIAWEKAFHAALIDIIEENESLGRCKAVSHLFLVFCCFLLMLPQWLKIILPKAKMDDKGHQAMIDVYNAGKKATSNNDVFGE